MSRVKNLWGKALICCAVTIGVLLGNAYAEDQGASDTKNIGLRASYLRCIDATGGVTSDLLNCDAAEMKYQDRRLNEVYKKLAQSLAPKELSLLRQEERKWITYRDSYCAPDPNGGTATDVDASGCKVEQTAKRTSALEEQLGK